MPFEDIPQLVLYHKNQGPIADLIREIISFSALAFTEISVTSPNPHLPEILPAFSMDNDVTCGTHAVCRRIAAIVGLHGSTPREDALVDAIASQILDLWEAVLSQKRKKLKDSKLLDVLKQLNSFVKASKNKEYLIGEKLTWADMALTHFTKYLIKEVIPVNLEPELERFINLNRSEKTFFDLY